MDDMALGAIQANLVAGLKPGKDITIIHWCCKRHVPGYDRWQSKLHRRMQPIAGPLLMETAKKILNNESVPKQVYVEEGIFPADVAALNIART